MTTTRQRLQDAAVQTIREVGVAGASARAIAGRAAVNQALIFYHFGSVHQLLGAATMTATEDLVARYRERLDAVDSVAQLVGLARDLEEAERERGNVTVLAQMLAGAQSDGDLRAPVTAALDLWIVEVERTLHRLLDDTAVADLVDVAALARTVSAAFVGIELFDGLRDDDAPSALDALEDLARLVEVVLELGPLSSAALHRRVDRIRTRDGREDKAD